MITLFLSLLFTPPAFAGEPLGCRELRSFTALAWLSGHEPSFQKLQLARDTLCQEGLADGQEVFYPNGRLLTAAANVPGHGLFYDGGERITLDEGEFWTAWHYPNGQVISKAGMEYGARWFYPNGKAACFAALLPGVEWFYPNGRKLAVAGEPSPWFYENGQLLSEKFGSAHSVWFRPDGSVLEADGPALPSGDLWEPPLLLQRLGISPR